MDRETILKQLNPEQAAAAAAIEGPVLVLAGAGTGKTRVITFRIAYMLSSGIPPEQILGRTFTNKAAREMRERLAQLVDPRIAERVTLGTFHSFCIRILRREIRKLGYLPGFTIADESDQQGLLKQAAGTLGCTQEGFPLSEVHAMIGRWKNKLIDPATARRSADSTFEAVAAQLYEEYQSLLELQNTLDFDDMQPGETHTYYVQSSRLGYLSEPSNTINVGTSSAATVTYNSPLAVTTYEGRLVRFTCNEPHTGCRIHDISGRLVELLPTLESGTTITLPYGAYIITTDQHRTPIKILVR